jgi:hypothetical protein
VNAINAPFSTRHRFRKTGWAAACITLLAGLATLTLGAGTSYAGSAGGGDHTTTYSTTTVPITATTGVAREYDFGPVFETEPSANCQVTIDWGDGSSSPASLSAAGSEGEREVTATHVYPTEGTYEATQEATPSEQCQLGTRTVTEIIVGEFVLGTNTNYEATIFQVTVTDSTAPAPKPTSTRESTPSGSAHPAQTQSVQAPTAQTQTLPTAEPPASLCGTSNLFDLLDVYPAHGRVHLVGYGDPRLAGQAVKILASWDHKVLATTRLDSRGYFRATAALPPRRVRGTNRARFQAQDGAYHSAPLKLTRRIYLYKLTPVAHEEVKLTGVVLRPFTRPASAIVVYRRDNCKQRGYVRVRAKVKLNKRTGSFTVLTEAPPPGATGAVYRLATRVRGSASAGTAHTFTLPRTLLSS